MFDKTPIEDVQRWATAAEADLSFNLEPQVTASLDWCGELSAGWRASTHSTR